MKSDSDSQPETYSFFALARPSNGLSTPPPAVSVTQGEVDWCLSEVAPTFIWAALKEVVFSIHYATHFVL